MTQAKSSKDGRWHFPNAIRKYGKDAFTHRVLEICNSVEEANVAEKAWIESFSTQNPEFGFNTARGGAHTPHPVKNPWDRPEFREKHTPISIANMKKAHEPAAHAKQLTSMRSPDSVAKRSAHFVETHAKPESKAKRSKISIELNTVAALHTPEARAAHDEVVKTQEYRDKISASAKKSWESPEFREATLARLKAVNTKEGTLPNAQKLARWRAANPEKHKAQIERKNAARRAKASISVFQYN